MYGTIPDDLNENGILFQMGTDGSNYQILSDLPMGSASLTVDGSTLYGIDGNFGAPGDPQGEVFSISIPEPGSLALLAVAVAGILTPRFHQTKKADAP